MSQIEIDQVVDSLREVRARWREDHQRPRDPVAHEFPSRDALSRVTSQLKGALFPLRLGPPDLRHDDEDRYVTTTLHEALGVLHAQALRELQPARHREDHGSVEIETVVQAAMSAFAASLPETRRLLDTDVTAAFQGDPAAHSVDEVLLCYPGVHAMINHRMAHTLHELGLPLIARIIAELAHAETGIDIHPGATIGPGFFIDHGTGVVIGETTIIGRQVRLYQAVTLGAKRFPVHADGSLKKGLARHPIVEDHVVIYAGATILGRVTIGRGAVIGGNVWITDDVPAGASVTQAGFVKGGKEMVVSVS